MSNFSIIINSVAPVFLIILAGFILKKIKIINDNFVNTSTRFVFAVALPALIFIESIKIDLSRLIDFQMIIYIYLCTIITFLLIWVLSIPFIKNGRDRSVFIQGSFRGNYAIIGLALVSNIFGHEDIGKAAIVLAFIIPLYNILGVIALTVPVRKEKQLNYLDTVLSLLKNPMILALLAALPFSYFKIPVNEVLLRTGNYFSSLTLPIALLAIGGSLSINALKEASLLTILASVIKLIIVPLALTYGAFLLGFKGIELGIMFILFASPTAIASYIMAEAMGCNGKLAGSIVAATTLGSVFTISIGLYILKLMGLI